ncbi:MAG: HlyD family efflux transporter periplasmic adaptor subunit [Phormidesmis sp.]
MKNSPFATSHDSFAQSTSEQMVEPTAEQTAEQTAEPVAGQLAKSTAEPPVPEEKPQGFWLRLSQVAGFVGLGAAVLTVSGILVTHRLNHVVTDNAFVNSRAVRLRSPIDGDIAEFYVSPGVSVNRGQVIARIELDPDLWDDSQADLQQLQQQKDAVNSDIRLAKQARSDLKQQLAAIRGNVDAVWTVESDLSASNVSQQEADVEAARARANAAQSDYERYARLLEEGAVSAQQVEQLWADWNVTEAEVRQALAALRSADSSLVASQNQSVMQQSEGWGRLVVSESTDIQRAIDAQNAQIQKLSVQEGQLQKRLKEAESRFGQQQTQPVKAPFSGIVYRTSREREEQVAKSESLATLLDCDDLWIEAVLPTQQVKRIDTAAPVLVDLASESKAVTGEVSLIQPISRLEDYGQQADLTRVQALPSAIPTKFSGKSLSRLTVLVSPPTNYTQSQQFCGVGQPARLTFEKQARF